MRYPLPRSIIYGLKKWRDNHKSETNYKWTLYVCKCLSLHQDSDLFGDDDDIFADIPVKTKDRKPRAAPKTASKSAVGGVKKSAALDDDMGELFPSEE